MPASSTGADTPPDNGTGGKSAFSGELFDQFSARQLTGSSASLAVSLVVAFIISDFIPTAVLGLWVGTHILLAVPAFWLSQVSARRRKDPASVRTLTKLAIVWKAASGATWGSLAVLSHI
ncbi:MAG: hypothetical protein VW644_09615 [Alphaproteobacteria bacterium]|jgi:hypothetical protein